MCPERGKSMPGLLVTHKAGMSRDVSVKDHRLMLLQSRVNAMESHARSMARRMYWETYRRVTNGADYKLATDNVTLVQLAGTYGVQPKLRDYAVGCFWQLVQQRREAGVSKVF